MRRCEGFSEATGKSVVTMDINRAYCARALFAVIWRGRELHKLHH